MANSFTLTAPSSRSRTPSACSRTKNFEKGKEADDGNDYFIYQKSKGKLWYDGNGDKAGKQVLVAKLDKGSDLDASEIFLI